jgi:hypothetical protein
MRTAALLAAAVAAGLFACDRAESPAPDPGGSAAGPDVSAEPTGPDVVVIPPFDPSLPPLEIEVPAPPKPQIAAAPRPKTRGRPSSVPPAPTAKQEPEHPSLDELFRARYEPGAESSQIDLAAPEPTPPVTPKPPRALDRLGNRIRLERRGEAIGPAGPRQGTAWETDAGLRIPVGESISLEGGVRVDSRDEPGKEPEKSRRTPRVGVEVRF